jgi:hypothetical protein
VDPDPGTAFFVIDLRDANKNYLKKFSFLILFEGTGTFISFSKIKSLKEVTKQYQGFSYYFCLMIEKSGSGSTPDPDPHL